MKKFFLTFAVFLCINSFAQFNGFTYLQPIYFGTDVFMPANKQKDDFKFSASKQSYNRNNHNKFKMAYSFTDNFLLKAAYKIKVYDKFSTLGAALFDINEFDFSLGWHKYISLKKYNKKADLKLENKRRFKINKSIAKGRSARMIKAKPKAAALIFETNLGYGFANLEGYDVYTVLRPTPNLNLFDRVRTETLSLKVERINLDFCTYYISKSVLEFSYNLRFSAVNFKKLFVTDNLDQFEGYIPTIQFVNANDPFFIVESNFKFNINLKYLDLYLKLNDVFGRSTIFNSRADINYATIVYNNNAVAGFSLNISKMINNRL